MDTIVCKKCGNQNIYKLVWIDVNTNIINYDCEIKRCLDCGQDNIEFITQEEYNSNNNTN